MLSIRERFMGKVPLLGLILLASACAMPQPPNCVESVADKGCVIEKGLFGAYRVGMTEDEALRATCARGVGASSSLFLYVGSIESRYYQMSICDLRSEALSSDIWSFVDPDDEGRYIDLHFAENRLLKIVLRRRGNDP